VRRALAIVALLAGAFLVAGGISVAVGDPYDSGRTVHVVVGFLYGLLGVLVGGGGWYLVRRPQRTRK
jgi:drug/metabolite transporter (DMT)-like permease